MACSEPAPVRAETKGLRGRRLAKAGCLALVLCLSAGAAGSEELGAAPEHEVKAAFLFNFTRFVEWPRSAFASPDAPFVIGIVGKDDVEASLALVAKDKTVNGRRLEVRRVDARLARSCQLVFLPRQEEARAQEVLDAVSGLPVLTVSEFEGFTEQDGVINFVVQDRRVRFEINPTEAPGHHLKISSKLLQLAIITGGKGGK